MCLLWPCGAGLGAFSCRDKWGRDVDMVLVGGKVVVEGGRVATINTGAVYAEVADLMPGFLQMMDRAYAASRRLEPVLWQVYERCQRQMPEMNRFATPPSEWEWSKGSR